VLYTFCRFRVAIFTIYIKKKKLSNRLAPVLALYEFVLRESLTY
jgi:hypothetical protein